MSLSADILDAMLSAGCSAEQLVAVMKADIAERDLAAAIRRGKDADRQSRKRERHAVSRGVTRTERDSTDEPDAPLDKEKSPIPPKEINPLSGSNEPSRTPRARKALHPLPDNWEPLLTARYQKIVDGWPPGALDTELRKFRNHAADKGRLSKDWQAALRNWIDKANDDGRLQRKTGTGGRGNTSLHTALAAAYAEEELERSACDPPDYPRTFAALPAH